MAVQKDISTLIALLQLGADSVEIFPKSKTNYAYIHYPTLDLVNQAKSLLLLVNKKREDTPLLSGKEEELTIKVELN